MAADYRRVSSQIYLGEVHTVEWKEEEEKEGEGVTK